MQVGLPEETDIRRISQRATELWDEHYGAKVTSTKYHREAAWNDGSEGKTGKKQAKNG